jgi:predicted Zn-dependent peptidase
MFTIIKVVQIFWIGGLSSIEWSDNMINEIDKRKLSDKVHLHLIKSDKFKTDLIGVYIKRPLRQDEAAKNALLTRVIERATTEYPTAKELAIKLEELYGAVVAADVVKYGEKQVLQFKVQLPNEKLLKAEGIFEDGLNILRGILLDPLVVDGGFDKDYFENEVQNLITEINGRVNDKMTYAMERCIEEMCADEPYHIYQYGDIEDLKDITPQSLYDHYLHVIESSEIEICVSGDIDFDAVESQVAETLNFDVKSCVAYPEEDNGAEVKGLKEVEDRFNINQGKLSIGYRTHTPMHDPLYEASVIFSYILGGGANSKLFKNVREKESLCYYIFARNEKYKSIMMISSGIEFENKDKALALIDHEFNQMLEGNFTEDDIRIAKDNLKSSLNSVSDFQNSFLNYYYSTMLSKRNFDIEARKAAIEAVTKADIIKAGHRIEKDTIHFLNKEEA